MKKRLVFVLGVVLGIGATFLLFKQPQLEQKQQSCALLDASFFQTHREKLANFVLSNIKKQCSYLYNTPDFIAKMTPYYKHKAQCTLLYENFFAQKQRALKALHAIGSQEKHITHINMILAHAHELMRINPGWSEEDALNQAMTEYPYCELIDGVYDDNYFECTALSLTIVAMQKLHLCSPAQPIGLKIRTKRRGRSKWRWRR